MRSLEVAFFQHLKDNVPDRVTLSWEELVKRLTRHSERRQKGGPGWSPTEYPEGVTRKGANVAALHLLVLDIDDGTPPGELVERWDGLTFCLHSTYSSTEAAPRYRVIFPLAQAVPREEWPRVWGKLAAALVDGKADLSCKDPSHIYQLPSHPPGDTERFSVVAVGEWLDETLYPDPPPPPPPPSPDPVVAPYWSEEGGQVGMETLAVRGFEGLRDGRGRHHWTLWLACQMRDNGYPECDTQSFVARHWVPFLPPTNAKGDLEPFPPREAESIVRDVYKSPPRTPWVKSRTGLHRLPSGVIVSQATGEVVGMAGTDAFHVEHGEPDLASGGSEKEEFKLPPIYTAQELQNKEIPPPQWVVDGLVIEGLTLLIGHSKMGKSFVGKGIAGPLAIGGKVLGAVDVEPGRVLYIAAEDGERRIKSRLSHLFVDIPVWPDRLHIAHEWPQLGAPGLLALKVWLERNPDTRLIVIDTFNALRPPHTKSGDLVFEDYMLMKNLKAMADAAGCGILVIHHAAQHNKGDAINQGAGTHGIPAAADTTILFSRTRGEHEAVLSVMGRDVEESNWCLQRDTRTGFWQIAGKTEEVMKTRERQEIYDLLVQEGPLNPKRIAGILKRNAGTVQKLCQRMERDGLLGSNAGVYYAIKDPRHANEV